MYVFGGVMPASYDRGVLQLCLIDAVSDVRGSSAADVPYTVSVAIYNCR